MVDSSYQQRNETSDSITAEISLETHKYGDIFNFMNSLTHKAYYYYWLSSEDGRPPSSHCLTNIQLCGCRNINSISHSNSGFDGLEVACWPLVPKFAGSNPVEAVVFSSVNKNPQHVGGHGCLSVVIVVCCQVEVSATNWSLVQRSSTDCGASLSVI